MKPALALLQHFGSLRTTLACMALLAGVLGLRVVTGALSRTALVVALAGLVLNLLFALWQHPRLRHQWPLLLSHLGLLALVLLAGVGQLAALEGRFELTQGVVFDGRLLDGQAGPWHRDRLAQAAFRHEGFEISYAPGRRRGPTRNTVAWVDEAGQRQQAVIGDHRPLVLNGYRIYTSPNKGFAPVLVWQPDGAAEPVVGVVHLPSFPAQELSQSREWRLPDGREVWVMLRYEDTLIDPAAASAFRLPAQHRLVLRLGAQREELAPGQRLQLPGGTLVYQGLRTWMGYRVSHDPMLPWLLAAALFTLAALGAHYVQRFRRLAPAPAPRSVARPRPVEVADV